jgi:hypothetical protein
VGVAVASPWDISGLTLQANIVNSRTMDNNTKAIPPLEFGTRFMTTSSFALGTGLVNVRCDFSVGQTDHNCDKIHYTTKPDR